MPEITLFGRRSRRLQISWTKDGISRWHVEHEREHLAQLKLETTHRLRHKPRPS